MTRSFYVLELLSRRGGGAGRKLSAASPALRAGTVALEGPIGARVCGNVASRARFGCRHRHGGGGGGVRVTSARRRGSGGACRAVTIVVAVVSAVYDGRICGALDSGGCASSHPLADRRVVSGTVAVTGAADVFALGYVNLAASLSEGDVGLGGGWR